METTPSVEPGEATEGVSFWRRYFWPNWERRKRMLVRQAWVLVIGAWIGLTFCYLLPQDFRSRSAVYVMIAWAAFLMRTLVFHVGLLLLVVAIVAAVRKKWRMLVAAAPLLLLTLGPEVWEYRPRSRPEATGKPIKAMSINLLMINKDTAPALSEIESEKPDLLLLQEYTAHWHEALSTALKKDMPHSVFFPREDSFGAAVYSKWPLEGPLDRYMSLGRGSVPQIRVVASVEGRRIAVYNVHLLPPRLFNYTKEHRQQFADLADRLREEKLPAVLAGDFNFTPRTPNAGVLRSIGMTDAHRQGGWGRGTTWPCNGALRFLPGIRLDQIWLRNGLVCTDCRVGARIGSDHLPVVAELRAED